MLNWIWTYRSRGLPALKMAGTQRNQKKAWHRKFHIRRWTKTADPDDQFGRWSGHLPKKAELLDPSAPDAGFWWCKNLRIVRTINENRTEAAWVLRTWSASRARSRLWERYKYTNKHRTCSSCMLSENVRIYKLCRPKRVLACCLQLYRIYSNDNLRL